PERFDATYVGHDNSKHKVVMIHRALLGAVERFMGILIEHYAGKLPLWLAPVQVKILTVADRFEKYAAKLKEQFEKRSIRIEIDARTESIGYKVREAQLQKIPLILTVGEKEEKNNTAALRTIDGNVKFGVNVDDLIDRISGDIMQKKVKFDI
ncbi:threonine--tRNA ligase, partial [Candidatus Woesearchaeota archaeon]|nr:threonine--tRNA ligase [Candidatus Woesearchaeota archaeon]